MEESRQLVREKYREFVKETTAINIERGLFNQTIEDAEHMNISAVWEHPLFVHMYKTHHCNIYENLKAPYVINKINSKELLSKDVVNLKPSDISPDKWKPQVFEEGDEVAEGIFRCKKCGSRKTTYYSVQTRSADEPMTNFITCVECKNRWKM
jgi:DNA-directed RNA polymerase subunit M/transcription elongation factor TFIIS